MVRTTPSRTNARGCATPPPVASAVLGTYSVSLIAHSGAGTLIRLGCAGSRLGPCASSVYEPRQGRKAAALSRSCAVPQAFRAAVGRISHPRGFALRTPLHVEFSRL